MFFGLPRQDAVKVRNEKTGIRWAGLANVVLYDFSIDTPEVFNVAFAGGRGAIMHINKLRGISEHPSRADKSAVGAINRPLHVAGLFC